MLFSPSRKLDAGDKYKNLPFPEIFSGLSC